MNAPRGILGRIDHGIWVLRRATAVPTGLRAALGFATLMSLLVAFASQSLRPGTYGVFAGCAILTALAPRTFVPTAMILLAVGGWLSSGADYTSALGFARLWLLAVLIYIVHSAAAMAAVLPYDALVTPGTFRPWIRRGVVVLVITGAVAFGVAELPALIGGRKQVAASVIGLAVTLAIAGYLAFMGRNRVGAHVRDSQAESDGMPD